jgi:hypothetical protein
MTIVGSKEDGINVADLIATKELPEDFGGVRLLPRPLNDGGYALPDAARTDRETSAAHSILAGWTVNNSPDYLAGIPVTSSSGSRLHIKQGDSLLSHVGGRGRQALTMPADGVFRFSTGPGDADTPTLAASGARRSQIYYAGSDIGPKAGETVWCAYSCIFGDTDAIDAGVGAQFMQWHNYVGPPGPTLGPPASINTEDGLLRISTRSSADMNPDGYPVSKYHYDGPLPTKGQKEHWVHQITPGPTGHWNVWRNGTQIVNVDAPIGYYTGVGDIPLIRLYFGQYSYRSEQTDITYFANPEYGSGSLAARITAPLPVPDLDW